MNITLEDLPDSEMDFAIHEHSSLGGCENTGREMRCDGERVRKKQQCASLEHTRFFYADILN